MFSVDTRNMLVPYAEFYKVERLLCQKSFAFRVRDSQEEVERICNRYATDYWTMTKNYGGQVCVAFISPRDALVSKLHFEEEVELMEIWRPNHRKPIRQVGLLQACTENYLNGLLSVMARKGMNGIAPNCFKNYQGSFFRREDIVDAIRIKQEAKRAKMERAERAPEELKNIPTKSLLYAYRNYRFDYDGECRIGKQTFYISDVKAVLDTMEHLKN